MRLQLPFSSRCVDLQLKRHAPIIMALRGPDEGYYEAKMLGTCIIRACVQYWQYGTFMTPYMLRNELSHTLLHPVKSIAECIKETSENYTSVICVAFSNLRIIANQEDSELDEEFFDILERIWESHDSELIQVNLHKLKSFLRRIYG